jgi:uncharacterized protein VirK/YbjX
MVVVALLRFRFLYPNRLRFPYLNHRPRFPYRNRNRNLYLYRHLLYHNQSLNLNRFLNRFPNLFRLLLATNYSLAPVYLPLLRVFPPFSLA